MNDDGEFKSFLGDVSKQSVVIVDEAYMEYTPRAFQSVRQFR